MNDISPRALPTRQDAQAMQSDFEAALNYYTPQIADALPDHIPLARFKRVLITAIHQDRELYSADRQSLFNACVKCAQDGLYPDGREAVLKVFNTKVKRRDDKGIEHEVQVPIVTYMPMIAGIRKRMRNSGEVLSAIAEVVYRNDKFRHLKGEEARIEHEPAPLDAERGEPVGAYAIIRLSNGETLREVMGAHEIEQIRKQFSRGSDGARSPWTTSRSEMWRKTVMRRCAKAAPMESDMRRLLERDDEPPEVPDSRSITLPPPRPTLAQIEADAGEVYDVTDCDAHMIQCPSGDVEETLLAIFAEAEKRGLKAIEAVVDNNEEVVKQTGSVHLTYEFAQLRHALTASGRTCEAHGVLDCPQCKITTTTVADYAIDWDGSAHKLELSETGTATAGGAQGVAPNQPRQAPPETSGTAAAVSGGDRPREDYAVPPVYDRTGAIAYRPWWVGAFLNRVRKSKNAAEFDRHVADNGEMIQGYYETLTPPARVAAKKELDDIQKSLQSTSMPQMNFEPG